VIEAPSKDAVYEMYKGYNVRHEGIQILRTDATVDSEEQCGFEKGNLLEKFNGYAKDNKLKKELVECANKYIQGRT
jgi:hypothetical protein